MSDMRVPFSKLSETDELVVDCVYEGGPKDDISSEVLTNFLPSCRNSGGIRWTVRRDVNGAREKKIAYIVLYTSMEEIEWPDYLDVESGVFHYYGDNRKAGVGLHDTRGNKVLRDLYSMLHTGKWDDIPPILIFRKTGERRNVRFLGLAAPGNPKLSADQDLVAFWRSIGDRRFQNYEAYFTILDTSADLITKTWLNKLISDHDNSLPYAPAVWREFIANGRDGIRALKAKKISQIPSLSDQMPHTEEDRNVLNQIYSYYRDRGDFTAFEACAADIVCKMDANFDDVVLTRPWRDGGRDALAHYCIGSGLNANPSLKIDCAIEAKCYEPTKKRVGVREMSRLISRIRYRQFGIMVTTAVVDLQAYEEVVEDAHPILILTGADIAHVLRRNSIDKYSVQNWLATVEDRYPRMA